MGNSRPAAHIAKRLLLGAGISLLAFVAFAGSATNTYDGLGRLTTVTYSNGVVVTYAYDAAGNRTSYIVTGAPS